MSSNPPTRDPSAPTPGAAAPSASPSPSAAPAPTTGIAPDTLDPTLDAESTASSENKVTADTSLPMPKPQGEPAKEQEPMKEKEKDPMMQLTMELLEMVKEFNKALTDWIRDKISPSPSAAKDYSTTDDKTTAMDDKTTAADDKTAAIDDDPASSMAASADQTAVLGGASVPAPTAAMTATAGPAVAMGAMPDPPSSDMSLDRSLVSSSKYEETVLSHNSVPGVDAETVTAAADLATKVPPV